jgi:hypothetical protein
MNDTKTIEERLRNFLAAPDDADWQDVLTRAAETPRQAAGRLTRRRIALALAVCIAVAASAVAFSGLLGSSSAPSSRTITTPPSRPLGGGTTVRTAAEADTVLPFSVVLPSKATPVDMTAYPQSAGLAQGSELIANFNTSSEGVFELVEYPTDWTVAHLQTMADQWKGGPAHVQIVDGVHVLIRSQPLPSGPAPPGSAGNEISATWIRGDGTSPVLTVVDGPWNEGQPFTEQQALAVAANIISQGG